MTRTEYAILAHNYTKQLNKQGIKGVTVDQIADAAGIHRRQLRTSCLIELSPTQIERYGVYVIDLPEKHGWIPPVRYFYTSREDRDADICEYVRANMTYPR